MRNLLVPLLLVGCTPKDADPIDLTQPLGPGQVRAGVITDESVLFAGVSAEGQVGDVLMYNDRVRFVVQGVRPGSFYVEQGGGILDADIVRPEGELGFDAIDEWNAMFGFARLLAPELVVVRDNGAGTGVARVIVEGDETAMALVTGVLEAPDLIENVGLRLRTEYILRPDSWFLEVRSTVTSPEQDITLSPGDLLMGSGDVLQPWAPVGGLEGAASGTAWTGYIGADNQIALMLAAESGQTFASDGLDFLSDVLQGILMGFQPALEIPAGGSASWTRYYGVGPDLATLTDARLAAEGQATQKASGVVTAPDGPVPGARVNVLVDGSPYTLAVTDGSGAFEASVPAGSEVSLLAVESGQRLFTGHPRGLYSPYAAPSVRESVLQALRTAPHLGAAGRGHGSAEAPLVLAEPGQLTLKVEDGGPFAARLYRQDAPAADPKLVPDGPGAGTWAMAWAAQGEVTVTLEPGTYRVDGHRGLRFEQDSKTVTVVAGDRRDLLLSLPAAYNHVGWMLADPHAHASPSGDGSITMEDRLMVSAGAGLQLHFGTDHDHVADYRLLLDPLGLFGTLASVVADEVSPQRRGHHNVYPLEELPEMPNNGAYLWYSELPEDTAAFHAALRERHGDIIIQANHPMESSGLGANADWTPGRIREPSRWSEDFDAIEVMNGGDTEGLGLYLDLVNRGLPVTPVGVSDSHSHTGGQPGFSATWLAIPRVEDFTPDQLRQVLRAGSTIVTRGPFLDSSVMPGSTVVGPTELAVRAFGPTWMQIDRLKLLENGVVVEVVQGDRATWQLSPALDASYVVIAEGDQPMTGVYQARPWAMTSAIFVDVTGDGWAAPLPPLELVE